MYRVLMAVSGTENDDSDRITDSVTSMPMVVDDVEVTVLNVFEEFEVTDEGASVSSEELYDDSDLPVEAEQVRTRLRDEGFSVEVLREHGDVTKKILEVADRIDADLIAMGGRKQTRVGKVIFGSTTQSVMLEADRPVMVTMS